VSDREPRTEGRGDGGRILYCHCAYAKVVPVETKREVLEQLGASGAAFEAVPDLCEMSARKDPALARLCAGGSESAKLRIAACYPRAVRWLFHAAGTPLAKGAFEVHNMREQSASEVVAGILNQEGEPSAT
jgi:hypothetical protein